MGKRGGIIPNDYEKEFLKLSYDRFHKLAEEIQNAEFWHQSGWYRYSRIKELFSVYYEILDYLPIKWAIAYFRKVFPPQQADIAEYYFKFIRNLMNHFPFFDSWDEVYITHSLAIWSKKGQIKKFLDTYSGHEDVKFRIWEPSKNKMTYLSISFPKKVNLTEKIYLKELISETEGVKFSVLLMKKVIDSQIVGGGGEEVIASS